MAAEPGRLDSEAGPDPQSPQEPGNPVERDVSPQAAQDQDQPGDGQPPEEQPTEPGKKPGKKKAKRPFWRELTVIVMAALVLTILLKAFVVQVFSIPSGSMETTLMPGDRVLVNKLVYRFRSIDRGDVVVFSGQGSWDPPAPPGPGNPIVRFWDGLTNLVGISAPGTDYIKRVIGLPGDRVACCDTRGRVTVNDVALNEQSYIHPGDVPSQTKFNTTVPAGHLWVMGDNRADSDDSRYRLDDPGGGSIPESAVVGRAFVIIWPTSRWSDLPIPSTFKQAGFQAAALATTFPGTATTTAAIASGVLFWRRRRRNLDALPVPPRAPLDGRGSGRGKRPPLRTPPASQRARRRMTEEPVLGDEGRGRAKSARRRAGQAERPAASGASTAPGAEQDEQFDTLDVIRLI